jgi:SAM-dependent methyltransferase
MTELFRWHHEEMRHLLDSCERDGLLPTVLQYVPEGQCVLESGCGAGRYVKYLSDRNRHIVGLEWVVETLQMVHENWPELCLVGGDCANSPFADESFDAVISLGVVEHWPEGPESPLRDIMRVLKHHGVAIITVPCHNRVRQIKRSVWWSEVTGIPRALAGRFLRKRSKPLSRLNSSYRYAVFPSWGEFFEYRMTPNEFLSELRNCGFEVLQLSPLGEMDGIYHELNPFKALVRFENWKFDPTSLAQRLNARLSRHPFLHPHMQVAVVRKPL